MIKQAIITGHSSGLGEALAAALLAQGAQVCGIARRGNAALAAQYGGQLQQIALDLSDSAALQQWLESAAFAQFCQGQELWLFNCAGTQEPARLLGRQGAAAIAQAVALNVSAPLMLADAAAALAQRLRIVHISSGAAHKSYAGWSVYGACKAALDHHARNIAAEAQPHIQAVSIAPGVIDTAMQAEIRANTDFPIRQRFLDLQQDGALQSAPSTAAALLTYCESAAFGQEAVVDIRHLVE